MGLPLLSLSYHDRSHAQKYSDTSLLSISLLSFYLPTFIIFCAQRDAIHNGEKNCVKRVHAGCGSNGRYRFQAECFAEHAFLSP